MAEKKNVNWADAEKRYAETPISMSELAAELGVSKTLAVRKLKGIAKISASLTNRKGDSFDGVGDGFSDSKVTQIPRIPVTRTPSPETVTAGNPAPTTARAESTRTDLAERPVFSNPTEELLWIEAQVAARQDELVARFETELKALRSAVYAATRAAGTDQGLGKARIAKTLAEAFEKQHKLDLQSEALRTRRELGSLYASGPRPCVIVVAQVAGAAFGSDNDAESIARSERIRHTVAGAREVLRKSMGDAKGDGAAIEKALAALEWDGAGNLIESNVQDVSVTMIEEKTLVEPQ
jgi:hypothetical protein